MMTIWSIAKRAFMTFWYPYVRNAEFNLAVDNHSREAAGRISRRL